MHFCHLVWFLTAAQSDCFKSSDIITELNSCCFKIVGILRLSNSFGCYLLSLEFNVKTFAPSIPCGSIDFFWPQLVNVQPVWRSLWRWARRQCIQLIIMKAWSLLCLLSLQCCNWLILTQHCLTLQLFSPFCTLYNTSNLWFVKYMTKTTFSFHGFDCTLFHSLISVIFETD